MRIPRRELLDVLMDPAVYVPRLRKAMEPLGFDTSAAILTALAGVESNYVLDEVGDFTGTFGEWIPESKAESFGLWQINAPTWYRAGLPKDWELLGVQLQMVGANWTDATASIIHARRVFDVPSLPIGIEGTIAQIGWQYGGPRVRKWLSTKPDRLMPIDFVTWLGTSEPFRDRAERFDSELIWALGAVGKPSKGLTEPGVFGTALGFYKKKAAGLGGRVPKLPGQEALGNLAGWVVLGIGAVVGAIFITRR